MKAVTVKADPERRLVLSDVPEPVSAEGLVLVSVRAISLNRGEVFTALTAGADGDRIGADFAGVVEAASAGSGFEAGQRVVGLLAGRAWAERVAVPAFQIVRMPDEVSFDQAAALPVAGLTAMLTIQKRGPLEGLRVLITGATGGVGMIAVQLAAQAGAHVTAYIRDEKHRATLMKLGAEDVVLGVSQAARGAPYDLIIDLVGGALLGEALGWLASRGVCVLAGNAAGSTTTFDADRFRMGPGGAYGGTTLYGLFLGEELGRTAPGEALNTLLQQVATGKLDPMIGATGSWSDVGEVANALLNRGLYGKAVLRVA